ncbi:MAG: amino acid adenylation domain-containing protein [Chamaesiphon sp.]|nr:amino acid adenylation domain-containing protein [Chamaesiphon sp.]
MSIHQFLPIQSHQSVAIAIKDAVGQLTYKQLNSRVNQLANYLRQQGVKPEVLVGIYTERSIDTAIAILGVLQAGGAFVPLDPAYPTARLTSILEDTKIQLILTQSHLAADITTVGINLFLLDTQWDEVARQSEELTAAATTPDNLAYIMYTSGSTGNPQGVQITLAQVECYLKAVNEVVKIQPDDVYLLSASFSFSSSIRQLLLPLAQGAKVVISSKQNTSNLRSLLELIQTEQITVFDTVASVWNYLLISLAEIEQERIDSALRLLIFSGGLLTSQLLQQVRSKFPQSPEIVNIYGQTETIGVCAYPIPDDFDKHDGYAPVGSPYPHNQLYLLNDRLEPVAASATGELYIAGTSLARGYLNNPQLTDRKFIPNPFTTDKQRLYKTGDLARYLPDGNLEIVGRQDFQIKIRGMRVEIEEIETVLMQHPDVKQAAVVGKERAGEQIIVAYIVPNRSSINLSDLRSFLKTKLTDYMMPSAFEILDALPLTPNHKLDRNRLPEPSWANSTIVPARDELELQLIQIWERVLGVQPIGISDNFFDLGGHSLIALQLFAQIERIWKKHILFSVLLESPTIAALADTLRQPESTNWSPLVLLKSGRNISPLFCIHPLGGNLFDYYNLVTKLDWDRPIYGLQAQGLDREKPPVDRIEDMASNFIRSIQTIQPDGPYFLVGYSFGGVIAFEIARQLTERGQKVAWLGLLDIRSPTLKQVKLPFLQGLSVHANRLQQLRLQQQIDYCIDVVFYRKKMEYRDELITKLSNLDMLKPELLAILDCNLQARKNYQPQVYLGQATLFWSNYQSQYIDLHPQLGWDELIVGGIETYHLPGDHISLMKEPHVQVLAQKLQSCLDRAASNSKLSLA